MPDSGVTNLLREGCANVAEVSEKKLMKSRKNVFTEVHITYQRKLDHLQPNVSFLWYCYNL